MTAGGGEGGALLSNLARGWQRWLVLLELVSDSQKDSYRQHFLRNDASQATAGVLILALPLVLFAYSDYLLFGTSLGFVLLLAFRAGFLSFDIWIIRAIRRTQRYQTYDRLMLIWGLVGCSTVLIGPVTRPPTYSQHIAVDTLLILVYYLAIPNRLAYRTLPPLLLTTIIIVLYATGYRVTDALGLNVMFVALLLTNVLGIVISVRLYRYRRQQYQAYRDLERVRDELQVMATTDGLTGVLVRRRFLEIAHDEVARYHRYHRPITVLAVDLDHFKHVNDAFGHAAGDDVLVAFARVLTAESRRLDVVGRLGGEEFAMLLPETTADQARALANRILSATRLLALDADGQAIRITASIGIAESHPGDADADAVLRRADRALYCAKDHGRDRLAVFEECAGRLGLHYLPGALQRYTPSA
ncbi:MAG: GGDEF domain-containing protein [Chloroflexi bacterium]|nr:GGDEF domain-containing protein [Chloroflexota bacterium]